MRYYCTLFDKNYLAKGLAMYESLKRHSSEPFTLYILLLDDETKQTLLQLGQHKGYYWPPDYDEILCYDLEAFVDQMNLQEIRRTRTHQEWCWTLASQLASRIMDQFNCDITYLDADTFFFSDPKVVHDEIGDRSIGIIPHRLIPEKRHLEVNGKFNVGWVTFRHTPNGRLCLANWAGDVRRQCDASTCGDQKYLDEWPDAYGDDLCIIENIGANAAPWNIGNYDIRKAVNSDRIFMVALDRHDFLVFYHFHELAEIEQADSSNPHEIVFNESRPWGRMPTPFRLTNYDLRPEDIELIYMPYLKAYCEAKAKIESLSLQAR